MSRRRSEWGTCSECGASEFRRRKYGVPFLCYECAAGRIQIAAQEMANKSGVAYENWLRSNGPAGKAPADPPEED